MRSHHPASVLALLLFPCAAAGQEALVPFDVPQVLIDGYVAPFQRLFDFDADGDLDAVGASLIGIPASKVLIGAYANPGNGAYEADWEELSYVPDSVDSQKQAPIAVGDLDGDGYDDFALALGKQLWRFTSNAPAPGFTRVIVPQGEKIRALAIADFDGDGVDDVALQVGASVEVHLAAGGVLAAPLFTPVKDQDRLIVAEADGDALPDVVRTTTWEMQPFACVGGALLAGPVLPFLTYGPLVDGGDVDGDGDTDLVAFYKAEGTTPARVEIFRRTGPLQWTVEPAYAGGPAEYLTDIDGDGDCDGVSCVTVDFSTYPMNFPSTFYLALNQDGVFEPSVQIPGIGAKSLAGAQDVDGDGDTDLVAGRCVYFNRGGSWKGVPLNGQSVIGSAEESADLDTDGDLDASLDTAWAGTVDEQTWRSRGDGSFALQPLVIDPPPAGTFTTGPLIQGDFDGDGDADVILGLQANPFSGPFFHEGLWLNSGGGSFHFSGPCAPPGVNFYVDWGNDQAYLVGDLEADGDLDIVMRESPVKWSNPYGQTHVYRNEGHAFFRVGPQYPDHQAKAITDFDQDGLNDLIITAPIVPGGTKLLRGLPAGSAAMFEAPVTLSGLWSIGKVQQVDVADFNQDGYPDVAQAGKVGHLFLNGIPLGMGTTLVFTDVSADEMNGSFDDRKAEGLDVNGDGLLDVIAGPVDDSERSWRVYLQKPGAAPTLGTSAFEPGIGVVLSPWLRDDADGDGDLDVWGEFFASSVLIHGPDTGARQQYGAGSPGSGGVVPTLGATGPFRVGETLQLRLRGAHGQLAYLAVSHAGASVPGFLVPGLTLLVDPAAPGFLLPWPVAGSGGPGEGGFDVTVAIQPGWAGLELYHQVFVVDAGAPGGPVSASNGLRLVYGP